MRESVNSVFGIKQRDREWMSQLDNFHKIKNIQFEPWKDV